MLSFHDGPCIKNLINREFDLHGKTKIDHINKISCPLFNIQVLLTVCSFCYSDQLQLPRDTIGLCTPSTASRPRHWSSTDNIPDDFKHSGLLVTPGMLNGLCTIITSVGWCFLAVLFLSFWVLNDYFNKSSSYYRPIDTEENSWAASFAFPYTRTHVGHTSSVQHYFHISGLYHVVIQHTFTDAKIIFAHFVSSSRENPANFVHANNAREICCRMPDIAP